jgi:hypothetical protein
MLKTFLDVPNNLLTESGSLNLGVLPEQISLLKERDELLLKKIELLEEDVKRLEKKLAELESVNKIDKQNDA